MTRKILALLTLTLLLAACQTATPTRTVSTETPAPPPVNVPGAEPLRIASMYGTAERTAMRFIVDAYRTAHPDQPVELITVTSGDGPAHLVATDGGTLDVVWVLGTGDSRQRLLDLTPYASTRQFDEDAYGPLLANRSDKAALYAVPLSVSPQLLAVNVDALDRAGVPIPADGWSWDQFRDVLSALSRASGRPSFEVLISFNLMQIYIEQLTGRPVGEAAETDVANAVAYFDTLVNTDKSMAPTPFLGRKDNEIDLDYRSFSAQETVVSLQEWGAGVARDYEFAWRYLPVPSFKPDYRLTTVLPTSLSIPSDTKKDPALAWDFIQFAASDEMAMALAKLGVMPARTTDPVRQGVLDSARPGSPLGTMVNMQFTDWADHDEGHHTDSTYLAADLIMSGQATADEAMAKCMEMRAREALRNP